MFKINNYHVKVLFKLFKIQLSLITVLQNKTYNHHTKQNHSVEYNISPDIKYLSIHSVSIYTLIVIFAIKSFTPQLRNHFLTH